MAERYTQSGLNPAAPSGACGFESHPGHRMFRAISLVAALALVGCSGDHTPPPAPSALASPTSRECPVALIRGGEILSAAEAFDAMQGHVPPALPEGFGLAQSWREGESVEATWYDGRCREISLSFTEGAPEHLIDGIDTVGAWSVIYDKTKACGNAVLGEGRCIGYSAGTEDGSLAMQFIGLPRPVADNVVRSVPRD